MKRNSVTQHQGVGDREGGYLTWWNNAGSQVVSHGT